MSSIGSFAPPPAGSMGDDFVQRLSAGDFESLAGMFEPDATLTALLPDGVRQWRGPERIARAFVTWFGIVDQLEFLETGFGRLGPRLQWRWRARVHGGHFGDAYFVVEQHLYVDPAASGRIGEMSLLCSGFSRDQINM